MTDVVGKATLEFGADNSGVKSAVQEVGREVNSMATVAAAAAVKASGSLQGIGTAGEAAAQKLNSSQQRARQSLERLANTLGRSRAEVAEYRAQAAGLPRDVYEPLVAKIREAEAAMGGLSAGQRAVAASGAQAAQSEAQTATRYRDIGQAAVERAGALQRLVEQARAAAIAERELSAASSSTSRGQGAGVLAGQNRGFQELTRDINEVNAALAAIERGAGSQSAIRAQTDKLVSLWNQGRITADQYGAAVKRLDASEAALARSSAQAAAQGDRFIAGLREQAETAGLTARQMLEYRAAQLGVGDRAAPLIARLAQVNKNLDGTGVSARQTAAALRMVPAQMTDIGTQLVGGQNPFLILIQQGGQLKDSFGGIGPMFRALLGMVTPFALAVGGVGAALALMGTAMYQGATQSRVFDTSLALTGNAVGKTAGQLKDMSREIAGVGVSQGKSAEVVAQFVNTGKVAGTELERVSTATAAMAKTGARSVDDLVSEFGRLADAPAATLLKLNEQYHFLSVAIYQQVAALEQQGRTQQAAALAQATYADAVKNAADRIIVQMSPLQKMWDDLQTKAKNAWSAMTNLGSDRSIGDIQKDIDYYSDAVEKASRGSSEWYFYRSQLGRFVNEASASQLNAGAELDRAETQAGQDRKVRAQALLNQIDRETRSRKEIRDQEVAQVTAASKELGENEEALQKRIAKVNEKYKDQKGAAYKDDGAMRRLADLRQQEASLAAQLAGEKKLTDAGKARAEFEQEIADLKDKKILTADQKSLLASQDAIRAQLVKNEGLAKELAAKQAMLKMDERAAQIQQAIASSAESRQEQYDRQLGTAGLGQVARQRVEAENSIRLEFKRYQDQLAKATPKDQLDSDRFREAQGKIRDSLQAALADQKDYYDKVDKLNGDWRNGAREAFSDYAESAGNVAQLSQGVFSGAFRGMEDALTRFVTTGKASFKDLATSILADLARIAARQAIIGAIGSIVGSLAGGITAGAGATSGGSMTGSVDGMSGAWGAVGRRAIGGPVAAGQMYEVNERGMPEVARIGDKSFLLMGSQSGHVSPMVAQGAPLAEGVGAAPNISIQVNVTQDGGEDQKGTGQSEIGDRLAEGIKVLVRREIDRANRPGGANWNKRNERV
ncbi:phage tail tape measure protein [Achromobacter sp. DH1f]|uniref:phage tail tape measure protein n=1 Tax=Achromobacter sp. DH1f TaxID=1397275 RepID=UPI0004686158|nr:phage tail tape measure protein [Achromobacter sp. DH1f]